MRWLKGFFGRPELDDPLLGVKKTKRPAFRLPVDRDPADALRIELRLASDQLIARRRRRSRLLAHTRRLAIVAATGLVTLVVTTGAANALGVQLPVLSVMIDGLVRDEKTDLGSRSIRPEPPSVHVPTTLPGISRKPNSAGDPVEIPLGDTPKSLVGTTFMAGKGPVCFAWARHDDAGATERTRVDSCWPLAHVLDLIGRQWGLVASIRVHETTMVVVGYASDDVRAITAHGPFGRLRVALTSAWTPDQIRVPRFRTFVGVRELDVGPGGLPSSEERRALHISNYDVEARLEDGRTVAIPL